MSGVLREILRARAAKGSAAHPAGAARKSRLGPPKLPGAGGSGGGGGHREIAREGRAHTGAKAAARWSERDPIAASAPPPPQSRPQRRTPRIAHLDVLLAVCHLELALPHPGSLVRLDQRGNLGGRRLGVDVKRKLHGGRG
eukprot:scaffold16043_cov115-Isochrysis_galbana.AAC.21